MKKYFLPLCSASVLAFLPGLAHAQVSNGVAELHTVLQNVYNQMMPMCKNVLQLSQAIAGLGTTFYIGFRVWKHIARAEPIDMFPLFRPFVMVILIGIFPDVLGLINGILQPSVTATAAMVQQSNDAIKALLIAQAKQLTGNDTASVLMVPNVSSGNAGWDKYSQPTATTASDSGGGLWSAIGSGFKFLAGGFEASLRFVFRNLMAMFLQIIYYAASLCIDTIRTFHMIVLAILGPFAFAFSCYDGFQTSLLHWLGKYINIYLWLPICNLLGATLGVIQQNMIQIDLVRVQTGDISLFSATDIAYLIFMLIGVVAYTTVPGLSNYIVHSHLPNPLNQKVTELAKKGASMAAGAVSGGGGAVASGGTAGGGAKPGSGDLFETNAKGQPYDPYQYNKDKIAG